MRARQPDHDETRRTPTPDQRGAYEAPAIRSLGGVHGVTQQSPGGGGSGGTTVFG